VRVVVNERDSVLAEIQGLEQRKAALLDDARVRLCVRVHVRLVCMCA
jgi:hypothetical protein